MNQLTVLQKAVDQCSNEQLQNLLPPIGEDVSAQILSYCFNKELAPFHMTSYPSPDGSMILINSETMRKIFAELKSPSFRKDFDAQNLSRVKQISELAKLNNIGISWNPIGFQKFYFTVKQWGFGICNLSNALSLNSVNSVIACTSLTGAAPLTMSGVLDLSWTGAFFLATCENYISNSWVLSKSGVRAAKVMMVFPVHLFEWSINQIGNLVEGNVLTKLKLVDGPFPINRTDSFQLNVGPKVEDLPEIQRAARELVKAAINLKKD